MATMFPLALVRVGRAGSARRSPLAPLCRLFSCWRGWRSYDRTVALLLKDTSPAERIRLGQTIVELAKTVDPERPATLPVVPQLPSKSRDAVGGSTALPIARNSRGDG